VKQRFPIPKSLQGDQKVFKAGPFTFDKRQGLIVMITFFLYWLAYKQLVKIVPLSTADALILFGPFVVLALAVAFVKHDGRHLDFYVQKKWSNSMKPKTLLWRRPGPRKGKPPKKPLRDSIQEALGVDRFFWEMLRTEDGDYLIAIEVEPVALSLASADDQQRAFVAGANLYNRLDFPIVEMTRTREGNIKDYASALKERVVEEINPKETNLAHTTRDYLRFLDKLVPLYNVYDRKSYFILSYRPPNPDKGSRHNRTLPQRLLARLGLRPRGKHAARLQEEAGLAYAVLSGRFELIADACSAMNVRARLLSDHRFLDFLKGQTSGERDYPQVKAWDPVTLEVGGYGQLSTRDLKRALLVAEKVRGKEPPAVGLGDLRVADKIAPEAARLYSDCVRIGDDWHATLFVMDYGPDVGFGDLRTVLNVPGRIKLIKFVRPVPQEKAIKQAGHNYAELEAARHTAANGDVISQNQRDTATRHAIHTLDELQRGAQSLFDVSVLIHCEAASRAELSALVKKVKTKLAGQRIEAKLAREEMFEGFKSSLGLGRNYLEPRYANRPLLTNPLACLFLHGTYTVNHRDGVLLGLDFYSGGHVVLDSRSLVNPHMCILGTPGAGKTVAVKAYSTRLRMRGHRVVIIDPEGDSNYGPVAAAMDGQYVPLGIGSSYRINPCDLGENYMNINIFSGAGNHLDEEELEEHRRRARAGALDGKCLMLTRLVDLMLASESRSHEGGLEPGERALVDMAWHAVYRDAGITEDPSTHSRQAPTLPDFFEKIKEPGYELLAEVSQKLYSWERGSLRTVFGGPTNVNLDNKYLVLQIAGVKGPAKAAIMYGLLDFLNGKLSDKAEPSDCFVDEFWSLLKYPMAADFAEEMFRSGRARNNAMIAITQQIDEFLGSEAGRVIVKISASQLILKQNKKTAQILDEFVELSDDQKDELVQFQKGQGYLVVQDNQVPMYVVCSEAELELFNTDPAKAVEYEEQRRRALVAGARAGDHLGAPAGATAVPANGEAGLAGRVNGVHDKRRITSVGVARQLLQDESYVPQPGDYEDLSSGDGAPQAPVPGDGGAGAPRLAPHASVLTAILASLEVPPPRPGRPPIHAVVGEDAPLVAYNLAGMLASAAQRRGREVLFVDAEGSLTRDFFAGKGAPRPDRLLASSEPSDLAGLIFQEMRSSLAILAAPEDAAHAAERIITALENESFSAVVVTCGDDPESEYADSWLLAATSVVAAGQPPPEDPRAGSLLESALYAEGRRGRNGTVLAALGAAPGAVEASSEASGEASVTGHNEHGRTLIGLPPRDAEGFATTPTGNFAVLGDPTLAAAFRPLAASVLAALPEAGVAAERTSNGSSDGRTGGRTERLDQPREPAPEATSTETGHEEAGT